MGSEKNENDKTSFKKILKVQQENGEKKKNRKKNVPLCGIDPVMSDRQADELTITPHDPMYT